MVESPLAELQWRGLVNETSGYEALAAHLLNASRTIYVGFDPSAASLHIGSLIPLLALRRFQLAGHRPIALLGGATGLIGDPSFKASERPLTDRTVVAARVERLRAQLGRFIDLEGPLGAVVVDNLEWIGELDVLSWLRDVGKHFSVNELIRRDSVRARLEREDKGLSYTEFSYVLLQAYDYLELARRYGCSLQIGGSDQWGNITSGMDLVRRERAGEAHALTLPLATKADGAKFGKTETGTVWLDAEHTSPYLFYQFWINTADADVARFLRYFTMLSHEIITELEHATAERPQAREAQRALAQDVTRLVHGEPALASAERITEGLFSGDLARLTGADLAQLEQDGMPAVVADDPGMKVGEALVSLELAQSNSAAMKLITSGAVAANGAPVARAATSLAEVTPISGRYVLLRRGKRNWGLVRLAQG